MTAPRFVRNTRLRRRRRLTLEQFEARQLLSIFSVTNNGDTGTGTLRQAINDANNNPGPDLIDFNLAANQRTIVPLSALPALTDAGTVIDGTKQPGYSGLPLVKIDGSSAGTNVVGFQLQGGSSGIKGLVIGGFGGGVS